MNETGPTESGDDSTFSWFEQPDRSDEPEQVYYLESKLDELLGQPTQDERIWGPAPEGPTVDSYPRGMGVYYKGQ